MNEAPSVTIIGDTLALVVKKTLTFGHYRTIFAISKSCPDEIDRIEVDFQQTMYIDSAGLGMLLILRDFCNKKQIQFDIINAKKGNVVSMIDIIGLTNSINLSRLHTPSFEFAAAI